MPLAPYGSLSNNSFPQITIRMCVEFLLQIGSALSYMHSKNIIHHDIKPQNILLFDHGFVLSDFSVSVVLNDSNQLLSEKIGTSVFMAPEISQNSFRPKPTDMWSLGITVYCLLYGKYPFNLEKFEENPSLPPHIRVVNNVMQHELIFTEERVVPEKLKKILKKLLCKNPEQRLTAKELVENKWLNKMEKMWNEMTQM